MNTNTDRVPQEICQPHANLGTSKNVLFVVLSYNGCEDTLECIRSLTLDLPHSCGVLVIDNASEKGVVDRIRSAFPELEIIELTSNTGWAGGNNIGIQYGLERGYRWICLVNNDTVFPANATKNLLYALNELPPALVHPAIYFWDEPEVAQLDPSQNNDNPDNSHNEKWHGKFLLDYAYGACLVIHREIIENIGGFDERFFLQLEETDYYFRARNAGYVSICDPKVNIYHKESRAFGGKVTPVKTYYSTRNTLLIIEKKADPLHTKLSDFKKLYWSLSNIAAIDDPTYCGKYGLLRWLFSTKSNAMAARYGILDFICRRFGKLTETRMSRLTGK